MKEPAMTSTIRCVSPVNGEVYAERPALSPEEAIAYALPQASTMAGGVA